MEQYRIYLIKAGLREPSIEAELDGDTEAVAFAQRIVCDSSQIAEIWRQTLLIAVVTAAVAQTQSDDVHLLY